MDVAEDAETIIEKSPRSRQIAQPNLTAETRREPNDNTRINRVSRSSSMIFVDAFWLKIFPVTLGARKRSQYRASF
jgi:hypothetical protein